MSLSVSRNVLKSSFSVSLVAFRFTTTSPTRPRITNKHTADRYISDLKLTEDEKEFLSDRLTRDLGNGNWTVNNNGIQILTSKLLFKEALCTGAPYFWYGFLDTSAMLFCAYFFWNYLGYALQISPMVATAMGLATSKFVASQQRPNIQISGAHIEEKFSRWTRRDLVLSHNQRKYEKCRKWLSFGRISGILLGCICGMWPILLLDDTEMCTFVCTDSCYSSVEIELNERLYRITDYFE